MKIAPIRLAMASVAVAVAASAANAEVFFGTYTPSVEDPTIVSTIDPWPYELRPHDSRASSTTQAGFETSFTLLNAFGTNFNRNAVYNEFVSPSSFSASHISIAVSRTSVASDTLFALLVERWNETSGAWENLYTTFGGARIRAAGIPANQDVMDLSVPFGNNPTGSPAGFGSTPATIEAGERYRLSLFLSGGGQGGMNWHFSQTPSELGAIGADNLDNDPTQLSAYAAGSNTDPGGGPTSAQFGFQFAFAFTDGNPIPSPSALGLAAVAGLAASRRRR